MSKIRVALLFFFALTLFLPLTNAQSPRTMNAAEIKLALNKLGTLCSVLHIGAHPDDENTALLAYLANEKLCRTAYLSLTRGEGGQNLIGSEKGAELGVIRTQELLAARRIDGAEQFFTRAIDFGFSKTAEETFQKWNEQEILSDVVWIIRNFRPDVVITRFPADARAGHGHHQASAILAEKAFQLAGDAKAFPEQLKQVSVWQPKRLLWNAFVRPGDTPPTDALQVDVGTYNPILGKSYTEIAAQSRSMHKSQGFGSAERRGSRIEYLTHVAGEKAQKDLLDDVEASWRRIEGGNDAKSLIERVQKEFDAQNPEASVPLLLQIHAAKTALKPQTDREPAQPSSNQKLLGEKRREIANLIKMCAGLWLEAISNREYAAAKIPAEVSISAINRSQFPFKFETGWLNYDSPYKKEMSGFSVSLGVIEKTLANNVLLNVKHDFDLYPGFANSQPYWLMSNDNYSSQLTSQTQLANPVNPSPTAIFSFILDGQYLRYETPILYRFVDRVEGEIYQPFVIAPAATVNLAENLYVFSDNQIKQVRLTVKNNADRINGVLKLDLPAGWKAEPSEIPISIEEKGTETTAVFSITPAHNSLEESGKLRAFVEANGQRYDKQQTVIDHSHIPRQTLFPAAEAKLVKLNIKAGRERIGYIMGSGDEIPEALRQIDYNVKLLSDEEIASANLSENFDSIIAGIRAYNTRGVLRRQNRRLLDFVKNGGNLIVQYNTNDNTLFADFAPFPLKIGRERVAVEQAPVKFLNQNIQVLSFPNKINPSDFENWTQERGLYFANEFDVQNYTPIFGMNDPNEKETRGSLLVARYGKGKFIYTGLSFFRQLPAGVPGAYRLFVNLISKEK